MSPGDRFFNRLRKRYARIVATSKTHVEYKYETLKTFRSLGKRETKPNTACLTRERFSEKFEAAS